MTSTYMLVAMLAAGFDGPAGGTLSGTVRDTEGAALAGVRVVVVEAKRNTITDEAGRYRLPDLPNGTYAVTFQAIGLGR